MKGFFEKNVIKNYRFKSILVKNLLIFFMVLLIPFGIISSFAYVTLQHSVEKEQKTFITERMDKIVQVNDSFFQNLGRISATLNERSEFGTAMKIEEELVNQSENYVEIMYELSMIYMTNLYIDSIAFYVPVNDRVITATSSGKLSELENMHWIRNFLRNKSDFYVKSMEYSGSVQTVAVRCFSSQGGTTLGYLFIVIDNEVYKKTFNLSNDNEKILIKDRESGEIIFASSPELYTVKEFINMNVVASKKFNWDYYYQIEKEYFHTTKNNNIWLLATLYISVLILCALLAIIVSVKTFEPIRTIMQYLSINNEKEEIAYYDINELSYIMRNLMQMIGEREKLNLELENRMLLLNNAQIYALQYQINPHFIYNTLEVVKWLVVNIEPENDSTASDVISRMAKIFKYSLNMQNYLVPLKEEIQNAKEYISILQVRYANSFYVNWDISPEAYQHKIVKLSLQPVIENSVFYGLQDLTYEGIVTVAMHEKDGKLIVSIKDNGRGISNDKLEEFRRKLESDEFFSGENMGLPNLQRRIKLICGEEYGLSIFNEDGFKVVMILP